jgi:purine nucleoside phosphorylase
VPEVILARHAGLRVVALSIITNLAAGLSDVALTHDQTMTMAAKAAGSVQTLLTAFLTSYE